MKKHTKIYLDYFGYGEQDYIPSELSGLPAVDIHHIEPRGRGGSKNKDYIGNLMALTREEHQQAEGIREPKLSQEYLQAKHLEFMRING